CKCCSKQIEDKFLLKINEDCYHETCMLCDVCGCSLNGSCFIRDNQLLCKLDYE
ncbi:hypothetical protein HELRODRAFT_138363, partial [Helobdella robusta]|uniref:LIM zinc-binding domain-containing protein n=1 Tax=Helobdella robusta TaxID=6412 RepID=T1EIU4_HELRO